MGIGAIRREVPRVPAERFDETAQLAALERAGQQADAQQKILAEIRKEIPRPEVERGDLKGPFDIPLSLFEDSFRSKKRGPSDQIWKTPAPDRVVGTSPEAVRALVARERARMTREVLFRDSFTPAAKPPVNLGGVTGMINEALRSR